MKFLIRISTDSELISYEAMALAFLLASFDHHITFVFDGLSHQVLNDTDSRAYGMVQSLELYDIDKAYHGFADGVYQNESLTRFLGEFFYPKLTFDELAKQPFDTILEF